MDYEVAVIGAGVMGSSAAYYLAKEGRKTVLIDKFPLPHSRGSSGGHSRITRNANYGKEALTPIMVDSNKEWFRIQEQAGLTIFKPSHLVCIGPADLSKVKNQLQGLATSLRRAGVEPQSLPIHQLNEKYRLKLPSNYKNVIDTSAGILLADKCLEAFRKLFIANGGVILDGWPVKSITPGDVIEIKNINGEILKVKSVVICPGSWFGPIMKELGLDIPVRVEKIGVYYWKIRDPKTPIFTLIDVTSPERHYYALPDFEYPGYMKLAPHKGPYIDPDERDKADMTSTTETAQKYVKEVIPFLEPTPSIVESCMYTVTPDESFILDRHPKYKNVVFAGGFSGTGFKIAPSCGQALARMTMGLEPKLDFSSFRNDRFTKNQAKSRL